METTAGPSPVSLLVCGSLEKTWSHRQPEESNWGQTFCSPAALRPKRVGICKRPLSLSALCHCCSTQADRRDLLQSFHSLSNYMKLPVGLYYRLSECAAGFIRVRLGAVSWNYSVRNEALGFVHADDFSCLGDLSQKVSVMSYNARWHPVLR